MHSFTSLWYKSAPNFSIDNQLDISRPSRYQGKSQLRVKLKQFLHQMGYGDGSSLFRFENGCSVQCLKVTFVRTMRKHKALHCNISVFCFFCIWTLKLQMYEYHCSISVWTVSGCKTLVDRGHS